MEIYSDGVSGNRIDYIAERRLRGYIFPKAKCALVTVEDDPRSLQDLTENFGLDNLSDEYFEFFFSPSKIVSGLRYLLVPNEKREEYKILLDEFRQSFYNYVSRYYKEGKKVTRAEVARIIWGAFNKNEEKTTENIDKEEVDSLLRTVQISEDEAWICDKFLELIIKYAIHILMWERSHVYNKAYNVLADMASEMDIQLDIRTVKEKFMYLFKGEEKPKYKKDTQYIVSSFSENELAKVTKQMQEALYSALNLTSEESIEEYSYFFYGAQKNDMQGTRTDSYPISLYSYLLFVNYFYYGRLCNDFSKKFYKNYYKTLSQRIIFEFFLDKSEHIGDISNEVVEALSSSIEIVLMLLLFLNDCNDEEIGEHCFTKRATIFQIDVLAIVEELMPKNTDRIDVEAIMKSLKGGVNNCLSKDKIKNNGIERIKKLQKKDKGVIVGSYYMYATSHEEVEYYKETKDGSKLVDAKERARNKERSYWNKRIKCFKKWEHEMFSQWDEDLVEKVFLYLKEQYLVYRNALRNVLDQYLNNNM